MSCRYFFLLYRIFSGSAFAEVANALFFQQRTETDDHMQKHMQKERGISLMEVIIVLFIMALPVSFIHVSWESYRERRYLTETAALFHQYLSSHKLKATYLNENPENSRYFR